ncbi:MAG TPA: ABC transporter permease [Planctomycetaceae bacterium]|nr:ABC transporter permease [Planctomycetaceae bacterium]
MTGSLTVPPLPWAAFHLPPWVDALKYIDIAALGVVLLFIALVALMRTVLPKTGAIAWVTAKEAVFQPLFLILVLIGLFALFLFPYIPYNTLGDDIKLLIMEGLTLIRLLTIFLAVWIASSSIADELDGKTALMALSKPVGRPTFIAGKYLGVMLAVTALFLILGIFFLNTISYKVVYDAREMSKEVPSAIDCFEQVRKILPGLILAYFETCLFGAIAVAVSTRFSLLPNITISLTIYLLGHLISVIVQSSVGQFAPVAFVANLSSAVLPNLDPFSMETAIAMEKEITWSYVGACGLYMFLFCSFAFVVSLLLFEDRDLA